VQSRWKDPRTTRSGASWGLRVTYEKRSSFFNVFNRPHKTKSWLRHWILITNTLALSAVSQIQSIRQILPLSLDIPMLKSSQLQGGWPADQGLCPWTTLGAPPPDPRYILNTYLIILSCIGGELQLCNAGTAWLRALHPSSRPTVITGSTKGYTPRLWTACTRMIRCYVQLNDNIQSAKLQYVFACIFPGAFKFPVIIYL